jgi:hypothetical protein
MGLLLVAVLAACGQDAASGSADAAPLVQRDTVGDTLVVRTVRGSAWGYDAVLVPEVEIGVLDGDQEYMFGRLRSLAVAEDGTIYAMDSQIPALRVYQPDGTHKGTWGRDGGGPGEFAGPDGGLAVLSDGRIAVRDPGNARIQLYSPQGEALTTWPVVPGGFNTSNPMILGRGDTLLTPLVMDLTVDVTQWRTGLQRVSPRGEIVDTVPIPDVGYEAPRLEARSENGASINGLPFGPGEHATWHPGGFFIHGISDEYSFTLLDPTGDDLFVARDGRIWVYRQGPGVERDDPNYDPTDPDSVEDRWRDTPLYDVFERDGTFLGTVEAPVEMSRYPTPVFGREHVWAVSRDVFDVQRIVRYRIEPHTDRED